MKRLCLVLGDQLSTTLSSLQSLKPHDEVVMAEVYSEATYTRHHPQKIALIFSAMRHFASVLKSEGRKVHYVTLDDPNNTQRLPGEILRLSEQTGLSEWVITEPGEWRLKQAFMSPEMSGEGINIEMLEDDRFLVDHNTFREFLSGRKQPRMEHFYRRVRRATGLLMDDDGQPVGGKWNYDHDNRGKFKGGDIPPPIRFEIDEETAEVIALVKERFGDHFGDLEQLNWPVRREQALNVLERFIQERLPRFGELQDAMVSGQDTLFHSLLSSSLNIGLLNPLEVCQAVEQAYFSGHAPINAVEGFIRQIIGWREYVRGVYWAYMPQYSERDTLETDQPLPAFYWDDGLTDMKCVGEAIRNTRENAYAHHIQRLMVTGNLALLLGCRVQEVCDWYLAVYVDAFEWVELPNTLGMALFGDGGIMASKPYCSSGKYINRMSNYCKSCRYKVNETVGDEACPFNSLYWDFLARHRERFAQNSRMGLTLKHLDRMGTDRLNEVRQHAQNLRDRITQTGSERTPNSQGELF